MADGELLTAEQAQAYLGIGRAAFWNFVKRYNVRRYRKALSGKRVFFTRADLDQARETLTPAGPEVKTAA